MDDPAPVGRDAEIAKIWAFLSAASGAPAALVITGDAGIGKTVVWRHVLQAAGCSSKVLSCQPTPTERPLAFSALDDLFGDVAEQSLQRSRDHDSGPWRPRFSATRPRAHLRLVLPGPAVRRRIRGY